MNDDGRAMLRGDLARTTLAVVFIGLLIAGSLWVLAPFIAALIWAVTIVVATWPVMLRLERALGGRRGPAVAVMTLVMLALLIVPLFAGINALFGFSDEARTLLERVKDVVVPVAPPWLAALPAIGGRAAAKWNEYAGQQVAMLAEGLEPQARAVAAWFAHQAGSVLLVLVQFLLITILSAVLYSRGETWGAWVRAFGRRLAGPRGERMVVLAGQSIRGVAMGVVITAVVQTVLAGLGLAVVGVPFTPVLTAIIFVFCIAQLGPMIVMLAATAWAFHALDNAWGSALLVWSLLVGVLDNFVRPVLIRRGADLPLLLIFAGVIGGLMAFGVVGIFVGPVVLAITYTLLDEWVHDPHPVVDDPYRTPAGHDLVSKPATSNPAPAA